MKHPFKSHRDDDGGPDVPCALCFIVRSEHMDPMTPGAALHEYEQRLARIRQFATMDEAWAAVSKDMALTPENEAHLHQGFDAGYAAAARLAGIALTEVQTATLREGRQS